MIRHDNWRAQLSASLESCARQEFEWGSADCALGLIVPAVKAQTGVDLGVEWYGQYKTAPGALRALRKRGFNTLADAAAHYFNEYPHPVFAKYGDVAAIETPDNGTGYALGIYAGQNGNEIAVLGPNGLGFLPRSAAKRAFSIT